MGFINRMKSQASKSIKTIVLPESDDVRVLQGAEIVLKEKFAKIVLLGDEDTILEKARKNNIDISEAKIINPTESNKLAEYADTLYDLRKAKGMTYNEALELLENNSRYFATMMVKCGDADGFVSGANHPTADTLRPALQIIKGAKGITTVSGFFVMQTRNYDLGDNGVFIFADSGVVENPNAEQLSDIALASSQSYYELVDDEGEARVAMLSYSTKGSAKSELTEKVIRATKIAQGKDPDLIIDGELQLDAAIIPEIQKMKAPNSPVEGKANILVFPDLNAGNIGYKLVQRFGRAEAYGPLIQGLALAVNDLSRGCNAEDVAGVVAITAVQAQNKEVKDKNESLEVEEDSPVGYKLEDLITLNSRNSEFIVEEFFEDVLNKSLEVKLRNRGGSSNNFECYGEIDQDDIKKLMQMYKDIKLSKQGEIDVITKPGTIGFTIYNVPKDKMLDLIKKHDEKSKN